MNSAVHRMVRSLAVLIVTVTLAATGAALGQTANSILTGTVTNGHGDVLPGATVVVAHARGGPRSETVTQADGQYTVTGLPPGGPYVVTASLAGFRDSTAEVTVSAGGEQRQDFTLELTPR